MATVAQLQELLRSRDVALAEISQEFADELSRVLAKLAEELRQVVDDLSVDGVMAPSLDAQLASDGLATIRDLIDEAGYRDLVEKIDGEALRVVDEAMTKMEALGLPVSSSAANVDRIDSLLSLTREEFTKYGDGIAGEVLKQLRRSVLGGQTVKETIAALETAGATPSDAYTIANTSLLDFYQQANNVLFESTNPDGYLYLGPDDKVTRPFCHALVKTWLPRNEIAELDNGQLPVVFVTRGGYSCRHSWLPLYGDQVAAYSHGDVSAANEAANGSEAA